ncbi:hypothetical protein ID866_6648 [Astraeus odoratus]|nr:hypothetical protein ID866_6648 [Astraeus odoratus]
MNGVPLYRQNPATLDWEVVSSYESDDCENRSEDFPLTPDGGALMLHTKPQHPHDDFIAHDYDGRPGDGRFLPGEAGGFVISRVSAIPPPGTLVPVHIVTVPSMETYNKMQQRRGSPQADMGPLLPERHSPLPPPPPPPPLHLNVPRPSPRHSPAPSPMPLSSHAERYRTPSPQQRYGEYSPVPDETGYPSRSGHGYDAVVDHHHYGDAHSHYVSEERTYSARSSRHSYQTSSRSRSRSPMMQSSQPSRGIPPAGEYARSPYCWP